jgi:pantetheine-phosphate adenylyltransferase
MFDRVLVAVVENPSKTALFPADVRVALLREIFADRVEVERFSGLLVDYARSRGVDVIVKGLRVVSDFDYELQMAQMNRALAGVETVFMPTNPAWSYLSSSLVREVARLGASVDGLVPEKVAEAIKERMS